MFRIHRNLRRAAGVSIAASLLVLCFAFTANAAETGSVLGDGVRLRSEPSTESEELDVLNQGDTLEILDSTNEDWYQVSYTGDDGEVYTGYVSRDLVSAGVTQTAVITGGPVELKSDAAAEADTLAQIPDGATVVLLDSSMEGWVQVSYSGGEERLTGYIVSDALYVNPLATGITASSSVILREQADSASGILAILDAGTPLDILSEAQGWYQVTDGTLTGYVEQQLLSTEEDVSFSGYGTVTSESLYLRSQPDTESESLMELPNGATFQITSTDTEGWYGAIFNGQAGYVSADYASYSDSVSAGYVQTTAHPVSLRAGAGTAFAELASIPEGTVLPVTGSYGSWYRVSYQDLVGYVGGAYVTPTTAEGYQYYPSFAEITASSLNLRQQPTTDSDRLAGIPANTVVAVTGKQGDWYQVSYNGTQGYIDSSYTLASEGPATQVQTSGASNRTSVSAGTAASYEGGATVTGSTGSAVADYAVQFLGNPYVWGGASLTDGCDCSGFVMQVYAHFGYSLPHSSSAQRSYGQSVSLEDIQPGDIVCYNHHVGIYVGDGTIISALGEKYGITYSDVTYKSIITIRRIFG